MNEAPRGTHVVIGLPTLDMIYTTFTMALLGMVMKSLDNRVGRITVHNERVSYIPVARNNIIDAARKAGGTHVLFLDHDMTFPADTLVRLLAHDKDIVCASYAKRGDKSPAPAIGRRMDAQREGNLHRMALVPTGCLLIRLSVFDRFTKPYFRCIYDEATGQVGGDDMLFSETARRLGFEIWCDPELTRELGHLSIYPLRADIGLPWAMETKA